jgi:hypothetical protein
MVNNVYERSFSYKMHIIQNACNLRYKDAYTSCYICHATCKKCTRKAIHMLQRSSHTPNSINQTHTKLPPKRVKVAWSRGLVKISASWSCVGTWIKAIERTDIPRIGCSASSPSSREWPDHASVLLLVHVFTFLVRIKSCSHTHRRRHSLGVLHLELPHNVLGVLSLVPVGVLDRQPTKGSTRSRWMWPRRDR